MGSVVAVWRYPVKSARGEQLRTGAVDRGGIRGDRAWACLDAGDGTVGSAKHPRRWGGLLQVTAAGDDEVTVGVGGRSARAGGAEADELLSEHLGRPARLSRVVPEGPRLHRQLPDDQGLVPDWMAAAGPGQELLTDVAGALPGGRFVDFGAVHLLTTGALRGLGQELGRAVDASRFRPNLVVDAPVDPQPGQELQVGGVVLRVLLPTPRCVVPGLDPGGGPATDRELLGVLARNHRVPVGDLGRAACFGVYAEVLQPGRVELGQQVR